MLNIQRADIVIRYIEVDFTFGLKGLCSLYIAFFWTETESRSINSPKSHVDRKSLVNKGLIIWLSGKIFSRDRAGSPERVR